MTDPRVQPADVHASAPAILIGSLAVLLAGGLAILGLLDRADLALAAWLRKAAALGTPGSLPDWVPWTAAVLAAYGLAFVIPAVRGGGRQVIVWITTLALIVFWAPVLALAAIEPRIAAPFIAAVWSGVCALAYAGKHPPSGDAN